MRFTRPALVALLTLATGSEVLAQADVVMAPRSRQPALLEAYTAYIGHDDLFNSNGVRLTRPAAILRQDRANVHAYGLRQRGDQGDAFFAPPKATGPRWRACFRPAGCLRLPRVRSWMGARWSGSKSGAAEASATTSTSRSTEP